MKLESETVFGERRVILEGKSSVLISGTRKFFLQRILTMAACCADCYNGRNLEPTKWSGRSGLGDALLFSAILVIQLGNRTTESNLFLTQCAVFLLE